MSLLNAEPKAAQATANPWAGKVRAVGAVAPWWPTSAVVAVVELQIANILTLIAHVATGKGGRLFVSAPSSKRGDEWTRHWDIADAQLREAVTAAALNAAQAMQAMQAAPAVDDLAPFAGNRDPELPF